MKIKYTQSARAADVDTDLALAMALEEDDAELCNSDDDFQGTGSSPVFLNQTLALRKCATKRNVKRVLPKNLRLMKNLRGGGEIGDAARLVDRAVPGKEMKIHSNAVNKVVLEATSTRSEGLVSKDREHRCKEPKRTDKRVLKDQNARSIGRAETNCVFTDITVLGKGDENGPKVSSGKLQKFSIRSTPNLEPMNGQDSTDQRTDNILACDHSKQQGQNEDILKIESKRKPESSICDTGRSLLSGGTKRVKTIAEVPENGDIQRLEQTEGSAGLDSLSFEGVEGIEIDLGAEVDEDMVICTQLQAPIELEFGQFAGELGRVAADTGKNTIEDPPKRKHNIYDILLGNNRTDRVPTNANDSNPTIVKELECDDVEEMETPGTAMRALVDEAELDYEGLEFNEEDNEITYSFECPICGINLIDISISDREQHVSDCLETDTVTCERTNPMDCLGREVVSTEETEIVHPRTVTIEILECPVCWMCIEELSTAEREVHTNACLEKHSIPCGRTNPGDSLGCEAGSTETGGASIQRNVITGTLACPVCGVCIEKLSNTQREEHTNTCLDETKGDDSVEVAEVAEVAQALGKPDVGPVVTWLINLNLGKYADIFVKEEIDWDTLKWLTEEDLNSLGITALGPRRKIVCAIQQLRKPASTTEQITAMQEGQRISDDVVLSSPADTLQGSKKSIADFFILPPNTRQRVAAPDRNTLASSKAPGTVSTAGGSTRNIGQGRPTSAGGNLRSFGTSDVPTWMCIPGTFFRVDAFKYTTGNCSTWFLTHFHTDHYQGLTRGFRHGKIFCSIITARLVNLRIGIPSDRIQAVPLNETVLIDGVRVTFIDANHCPGSVMILFEPPNGKAVLHTGDFRFCSDMTCNEVLRACRITTLILDTTYCDPQYDFPNQDAVIQFVIDAIQAEAFNAKTLFLIGTYTIGKERIFLEVGKALQKYVYVGAAKQRLLDCMDLAEEDRRWLTSKDQESHIHVVPLWSVASFKRMGSISRHYHGRYNSIVAFSPTGWSFGKDKKRIQGRPGRRYQQGSIIRYEVPYSEHCSFTELKGFVRTIGSENIVPSVISSTGLTPDAMVASLLSEV